MDTNPELRSFIELLPAIRACLRLRIQGGSLRQVAREVGMSPSGLNNLVEHEERQPYGKTITRLLHWYAEYGQEHGSAEDNRRIGIELLIRGVTQAEAREPLARIVAQLAAEPTPKRLAEVEAILSR
jgi:hypothetical protein